MYNNDVRTTLDIDDDLIDAARQLARQQKQTMGSVVSDLVRKALEPAEPARTRNGVPLFTPQTGVPKSGMALVNRLRDGE